MKKICLMELLSAPQLNRFADIRKQEMMRFLETLVKCSEEAEACNLGAEANDHDKQYHMLIEEIEMEHDKEKNIIGGERERKDMMDILLEISEDESAEVKLTRNDIKLFFLVSSLFSLSI
ncbi:hypothetical protein F0562_017163 [Nyssa sinensis]|uniref:Uncharacterized protein n=1 Tax=Nyssa sinensis TaxID=561372 RepID=A0A5J4ZG92_9ASTE|nr:hypothetical protein F0562_017163 [Nyssa sinensis]